MCVRRCPVSALIIDVAVPGGARKNGRLGTARRSTSLRAVEPRHFPIWIATRARFAALCVGQDDLLTPRAGGD